MKQLLFIDPTLSPQNNQDWQLLIKLLKNSFTQDIHQPLMQLLLTSDERAALGTRVRIIQELIRGKLTQRELRNKLGTGITTITRGSNGLKMASPELKNWLSEQLLHEQD